MGAHNSAFLTSSQGTPMLLVQKPHLEDQVRRLNRRWACEAVRAEDSFRKFSSVGGMSDRRASECSCRNLKIRGRKINSAFFFFLKSSVLELHPESSGKCAKRTQYV